MIRENAGTLIVPGFQAFLETRFVLLSFPKGGPA